MGWFVDDKKQLVFVHIPKTGGTSVANISRGRPTPLDGEIVHGRHRSFKAIGKGYKCACFCREPYGRFESIFKYFNGRRFRYWGKRRLPFDAYVRHAVESNHYFFKPQVWYIAGAKKLFIYRFEDYSNEYKRFLSEWGFPVVDPPHYRKSGKVEVPWTEELRGLIYNRYRCDFEFFDYEVV